MIHINPIMEKRKYIRRDIKVTIDTSLFKKARGGKNEKNE